MDIIFYLILGFFGLVVTIFLLTVFFGAPYVPSHKADLVKLFTKLKLNRKDILVDIGSGDGVVLKIASQFGAQTIGFEINPFLVTISKFRLRKAKNSQVFLRNFWHVLPLEQVSHLYTFGHAERISKMLALAQLQANSQQSPLTFISYGFEIPNLNYSRKIGAHFIYKIQPKTSQKHKNML